MTTQPQEPPVQEPSEAERVRWNVELRLLELGFGPGEAHALAEAHVDWHDAKHLLDRGCDVRTAVEILL